MVVYCFDSSLNYSTQLQFISKSTISLLKGKTPAVVKPSMTRSSPAGPLPRTAAPLLSHLRQEEAEPAGAQVTEFINLRVTSHRARSRETLMRHPDQGPHSQRAPRRAERLPHVRRARGGQGRALPAHPGARVRPGQRVLPLPRLPHQLRRQVRAAAAPEAHPPALHQLCLRRVRPQVLRREESRQVGSSVGFSG